MDDTQPTLVYDADYIALYNDNGKPVLGIGDGVGYVGSISGDLLAGLVAAYIREFGLPTEKHDE